MKRFTALLLLILFIPLCSCSFDIGEMVKEFDLPGALNDSAGQNPISGDIIKIKPSDVTLPTEDLCAYTLLNGNQRAVYSIMLTAVSSLELRIIDVTDYVSGDGFSDAVAAHRALLFDRPDLFWIPKTFSVLTLENRPEKYICFRDYYASEDDLGYYGITKEKRDEMKAELDAQVDIILEGAAGLSGAFNKELYFHDYICENTVYDSASANDLANAGKNTISAYGALVENTAVCEGYARAMQLLCLKSGIPCNLVIGEHDGVPHMWNIINPGDGYYYLDPTFDDSSATAILHNYFNVTKSKLLKSHIFEKQFIKGQTYDSGDSFNFYTPDCENTYYNYFEKTGSYIDDDCYYAVYNLRMAVVRGDTTLELINKTSLSLTDAFALLQSKAKGIVRLEHFYRYEGEDIIVAVW